MSEWLMGWGLLVTLCLLRENDTNLHRPQRAATDKKRKIKSRASGTAVGDGYRFVLPRHCRVAAVGWDFFFIISPCGYRPFPSQCFERVEKGNVYLFL